MRTLLLLFFLGSCLTPNLEAQTVHNIWEEMETYILKHLENPIPDEAKIIEIFRLNSQLEDHQAIGAKELVELVRRNHWEKKFIADHQEEVTQAKEKDKGNMPSPIPNPDLVNYCPLNIVVIVDRSGSINPASGVNIKAGLLALTADLVGTGNTLTIIGMLSPTQASASETITYSPGNPASHELFINFGLDFGGARDSWSGALNLAIPLVPDLVLIITNGNNDHGANEGIETIAAANALKSNGANNGNGAHICVIGEVEEELGDSPNITYENYANPSIEILFTEAVDLFIAPNPVESLTPLSLQSIGTSDQVSISDPSDFGQLPSWFSNFQFTPQGIEITDILNEPCESGFGIKGTYDICQGSVASIELDVYENFTVIATLSASINTNDNTWNFSASYSELVSLGFQDGQSYDVYPRMTLSDGTVFTGSVFVPGIGNDFLFEVLECCATDGSFFIVPECVSQGEVFTVAVVLDGIVPLDQIEEIYSDDNNYTYVDHSVIPFGTVTLLYIDFISETCTCEGEMLVFDIRFVDCGPVTWMMTDKIPCCAEECKAVTIEDWSAEDCTIVNGNPARYFCIEVSSPEPITAIYPATNTVFCQTTLVNLEVTNTPGTNDYSICGFMVFDDPGCTIHAKVSLKIETASSCCTLEQSFSFPAGCDLTKECMAPAANLEIIIGNGIDVSIGIPQGEVVTVIDHVTNSTDTYTVGLVHCGPFAISSPGGVINPGNPDCTGIVLPTPALADCFDEEIDDPDVNYHYEIEWNNCVWIIIGNLCKEPIVTPGLPGFAGSTDRNGSVPEEISLSDQIKVFPNPMDQSGFLNFDFGGLKTPVSTIEVRDVSGKIIESFIPVSRQNKFQHQLNQPLSKGIYFLVFRLENGQVSSTKLVSLN